MTTRNDGVLDVDSGGSGPGTSVTIVDPIGPNIKADSVSITVATDEGPISVNIDEVTASGVLIAVGQTVTLTDLTNIATVGVYCAGTTLGGTVVIEATIDGINWVQISGWDYLNNQTILTLDPVGDLAIFNAGGLAQIRARVLAINTGNITIDMRGTATNPAFLTSFTEITGTVRADISSVSMGAVPTHDTVFNSIFVDDNTVNPTTAQIQAFPMVYDGITWDRLRGNETEGAYVTIRDQTGTPVFPPSDAPADNITNSFAASKIQVFPMLFDGVTWDRARGNSVDGALVNLGANNDVDTELPPAALLSDVFTNPTAPAVGAFGMLWNGVNWIRMSGNSQGLNANINIPSNITTFGTINALSESVGGTSLSGYNSFLILLNSTNFVGTLTFTSENSNAPYPVFNIVTGKWITELINVSEPVILSTPPAIGSLIITCSAYTSGSVDVSIDGSMSTPFQKCLTNDELRENPIEIGALVSSESESYTSGDVRSLSLNPQGRLRVSTVEALDSKLWGEMNPWEVVQYPGLSYPLEL